MSILSHLNLRAASRLLLTVGAAGLLAACSSEPEQPKGPTPEEIAKEAQGAFVASVPGVYEGVLPCADCSGIRTELYVRAKGSYTRVSHYEGKDGSFEEAWNSPPTRRRSRAPRSSSSRFSRTIRLGRPFRRDPPCAFLTAKASPLKGRLPNTTFFARTDAVLRRLPTSSPKGRESLGSCGVFPARREVLGFR